MTLQATYSKNDFIEPLWGHIFVGKLRARSSANHYPGWDQRWPRSYLESGKAQCVVDRTKVHIVIRCINLPYVRIYNIIILYYIYIYISLSLIITIVAIIRIIILVIIIYYQHLSTKYAQFVG